MNCLFAQTIDYYPNALRILDPRRPSVWVDFEVTAHGARYLQASCTEGENMRESAQLLAALAA